MPLKKISSGKSFESLDKMIGRRIKMRRTMLEMTQGDLASHIEVSFQQLQKYESGSNRISAKILYQLSKILQVDMDFFFSQEPQASSMIAEEKEIYQNEFKKNNQLSKLIELYMRLPSEEARRRLMKFIEAIVDEDKH